MNKTKQPGRYADGGGLYLVVRRSGARSWVFRYTFGEYRRDMGLGSLDDVSLAEARDLAETARAQVRRGNDPITARQEQRVREAAGRWTFEQCAEEFLKDREAEWKNEKHRAQWRSTLASHAYPKIGRKAVGDVGTDDIVSILKPIWSSKTETATRLRGRIEKVLDWATVKGLRSGENPARWRGHLDHIFPRPSKVAKVKHFAALPWNDLPSFMSDLRKRPGIAARALEFTVLTGVRSGETRLATWGEFDLDAQLWLIPGERMKTGREHRVPLSERAVAILEEMRKLNETGYVFPGAKRGKPLSDMTLTAVLRRMKRDDITTHGFRSTFRDWVAETTAYPRDVAEMALAHSIPNKVEAAYRRGDLIEKRRRLMNEWAAYCERTPANGDVVPLREVV